MKNLSVSSSNPNANLLDAYLKAERYINETHDFDKIEAGAKNPSSVSANEAARCERVWNNFKFYVAQAARVREDEIEIRFY